MATAAPANLSRVTSPWQAALLTRKGLKRSTRPEEFHVRKSADRYDVAVEPNVDATRMCASATISTPTEDRTEDIVEPLGIQVFNYAKNPVVYFDHGESGITLPIAKSETPDGILTVEAFDEGVTATSYFSQSLREAAQIFELVAERIIRTTSVNLMPKSAMVRPGTGREGRPGLHITEWELLEWSWVGIPDNPEAVAKWHEILTRGRLCGDAICEPILKHFRPIAPKRRAIGKGCSCEDHKMAGIPGKGADEEETGKSAGATGEEKPKPGDAGPDDSGGKPASDEESGEGAPAEGSDEEEEGDPADGKKPDMKMLPQGGKLLTGLFTGLGAVHKSLTGASALCEHKQVRSHAEEAAGTVAGVLEATAKCYAKHYTGFGELKMDDGEDGGDEDVKSVRKFLDDGQNAQLQLRGLIWRAKSLALGTNKPLGSSARGALNALFGRLEKMLEEAKPESPAAPAIPAVPETVTKSASTLDPKHAETLAKSLEDLATTFRGMEQKLSGVVPQNR